MEALTDIADEAEAVLVAPLQEIADRLYRFRFTRFGSSTRHASDPTARYARIASQVAGHRRPTLVTDDPTRTVMDCVERRFTDLWTDSADATNAPPETSQYKPRQPRYAPPPAEWVDRITTRMVRDCMAAYDWRTASGTDGLSIVFLKALSPSAFAHHLSGLFRILLRLTSIPRRWNESLTILLPKDSGRTCAAARTRPITMTPMFRRMFEKVTLPFLEDHPQLQLLPAQTGFQKHKSTAINITLLQADLQDKEVRTVLIDMADCYDRLSFAYQLKVWKQRKLEPYLITLMTSLVHR